MSVKKEMIVSIVFFVILLMVFSSFTSAGIFDWFRNITGKATTQTVSFNISVGGGNAPTVTIVYNNSIAWPATEGVLTDATSTTILVNFTATDADGTANLDDTTAMINITNVSLTGEASRANTTCTRFSTSGNSANYTCKILLWWFDGNGTYYVNASISDLNSNKAQNSSTNLKIQSTTSFTAPAVMTWGSLSPGATNQTPSNSPMTINNTANYVVYNISINATNLRGEQDSSKALWAGNFTVNYVNGGSPPLECNATAMVWTRYTQLNTANLTKGNFTLNNGNTGQEQLYQCLRIVGSELSTQSYSTFNESTWTIKVA